MIVAKRYAKAFLQSFPTRLTCADIENIKRLGQRLTKNKQALSYLKMSLISPEIQKELLQKVAAQEQIGTLLDPLLTLLAQHRRLALLPATLSSLCTLFYEKEGYLFFSSRSSQQLSEGQTDSLIQFLTQHTRKKIVLEQQIDAQLIAGVRAMSSTYLWEDSINKKIHALARAALTRK